MEYGLLDDGGDGEYYGIGLGDMSKILATQGDFFYGTIPFDRV